MGLGTRRHQADLADENATLAFGAQLAGTLRVGVVYLRGDLGAGKTTLVRGYLRALGYEDFVKSPTYTLVELYEADGLAIAHLDLYRINDPHELEFVGLEDVLSDADIVFVEWPDRGLGQLPQPVFDIEIVAHGAGRSVVCNDHRQENSLFDAE